MTNNTDTTDTTDTNITDLVDLLLRAAELRDQSGRTANCAEALALLDDAADLDYKFGYRVGARARRHGKSGSRRRRALDRVFAAAGVLEDAAMWHLYTGNERHLVEAAVANLETELARV